MVTLLRLSVTVLALAAAQTMMAAEPAEAGAAPEGPAAADAAAKAPGRAAMPVLTTSLVRFVAVSATRLNAARQAVQSVAGHSVQQIPPPSLLEQLPMLASLRRRAGEHWNTTDSSRPSDFALCYRFSRVMGLQVIPGDLSPGKLPTPRMLSVKSQGSGMGVLVGMTFRLGASGK